jgi:hypothetical protein
MLLKKKNQLNYRFMESEQNFCLKRIKNKLYKTYLIILLANHFLIFRNCKALVLFGST